MLAAMGRSAKDSLLSFPGRRHTVTGIDMFVHVLRRVTSLTTNPAPVLSAPACDVTAAILLMYGHLTEGATLDVGWKSLTIPRLFVPGAATHAEHQITARAVQRL
jgi:hypothetical protein